MNDDRKHDRIVAVVIAVILIAFAAALLMTPSLARAHCIAVARYARMVQSIRQFDGEPVEEAYNRALDDEQRAIVVRAYKSPRYKSIAFRAQAVDEFATTEFLNCEAQPNATL